MDLDPPPFAPYLTAMQATALAVAGMCHALLGSIKVPLARRLQIDEGKVGGLVSVFGFTLIPMAFAAGILADSQGKQFVIVAGCGLTIASVLVLANVRNYAMALISVLLLGTGWSALVNVLNQLQGYAFRPLRDGASLSFAMNLGDFIFGLGAFVMPIVVAWSLTRFQLKGTFFAFAGLIALPLLLTLGVDWTLYLPTEAAATDENAFAVLLRDRVVLLCCIAFFFHVPVEASIATWATTLMTDRGVSEKTTSTMLSAFWLTFTVSRLVAALLMSQDADHTVLILLAVLMPAITIGLIFSHAGKLTCSLLLVAGAVLGPIFPILIALLVGHVKETNEALEGRSIGLFFCIGGIGWALIPFIVGQLAKKTGVQKAFCVVAGCGACLTILTILLNNH
jgi:fucose permease